MNTTQEDKKGLKKIFRGWPATFSSLENRSYRWYWLSNLSSSASMQMQMVARGWLVWEMTDSATALGWVSFAAGAALLVFSPFGGVAADRIDKRKLLIVTQTSIAIATLIVAVLIVTDSIEVWHLIVASLLTGTIFSFNMPGRQALVPNLVEQHQLMNAIALNSGSMNVTRIIAPALGGVLVGVAGISGVYFLMVVFNLVSAALLFLLPTFEKPERDPNATIFGDLVEGARYARHNPVLLSLLTMAVVPILFGMPYMMLMPIFAEGFGREASGVGFLLGAGGIGALVGSMVIATLGDFRHKGWLILGGALGFGIFLVFFAISSNFYLALAFLVGVGLSNSMYMAANNSLMLLHTEDRIRGRVMSLYMMTIGIFPVAVLPVGILIDRVGSPGPVVGAGGGILIVFIIAMAVFRPSLRRL